MSENNLEIFSNYPSEQAKVTSMRAFWEAASGSVLEQRRSVAFRDSTSKATLFRAQCNKAGGPRVVVYSGRDDARRGSPLDVGQLKSKFGFDIAKADCWAMLKDLDADTFVRYAAKSI